MLEQILQNGQLIFYILAVEGIFLCLLQLRTNRLLRRDLKAREQKKEKIKQLKEEVKTGSSEIPVVKFEKQKEKTGEIKKPERKDTYDAKEMAILQEMLAEYFG